MRLLFVLLFFISFLYSKELQKVSIQLQWLDQFQFAGYYIAKEKGFYEELGLDVEIKKYDYGIMPVDEVVEGRATFGVGRSSLVIDKTRGKDIVALSAIYQTSPLILLALESSGIKTINDFIGKKIMATDDAEAAVSIKAMIKSSGLNENTLNFIPHSFNLDDLINGKTDLMASYISNEPYVLEQKGLEYIYFDPKDYGFDLYSDILFTSSNTAVNNPHLVERFRKASLKGWRYAFKNIDESVNILFEKYNSQNKTKDMLTYEAKELKKLAYYETQELGKISKDKLKRAIDIYRILGILKQDVNIDSFVYKPIKNFTLKQRKYLDNKDEIKVCIDPYWRPFEYIQDNRYQGITADYLNAFSNLIQKDIILVPTKSWKESKEFVKQRKCDMLSAASYTPQRAKFLDFTTPYLTLPYVIATDNNASYIYNLNLIKDKKIGMVKGYSYIKVLKEKYPKIKIIEFKNLDSGLKALSHGEIFAFIDTAATIGYMIRKKHYVNLKISGQLKDVWSIRIATRNDEPILNELMQFAVDNLDENKRNEILNKWQTINIDKEIDYGIIWKLILFFFVLFVLFLYAFHKLKVSKELAEESLSNIEKILDTTIEAISVSDENKNIFIINKSAINIFGYTKEEFLKLSILDVVAPGSLELAKKSFSTSTQEQYELELVKKDGTVFPALATGKDIIYKGEKARISTIIDLTSLKKAQMELEKLNNELEIRVEEEVEKNLKKEKLIFQQTRQAQMGELISMIAHQWRQPLSTISLTIIAIKLRIDLKKFDFDSKVDRGKFIDYLDKQFDDVLKTVNDLSEIINDFRVFYKPNKKMVKTNINEIINKSINIIDISLKQDNIEVIKELSCDCELEIYDNEMVQVILNILKNAQDNFTIKNIENKTISIKTFCAIDQLNIVIEDNGGGIDEEILPNIFDPYFSTKDEKNGTGLGLHMSNIIIEEHHKGKLYAENTDGGVKFVIELKR